MIKSYHHQASESSLTSTLISIPSGMKNLIFSSRNAHIVLIFIISYPSRFSKKCESFLSGFFVYILRRGMMKRRQVIMMGRWLMSCPEEPAMTVSTMFEKTSTNSTATSMDAMRK